MTRALALRGPDAAGIWVAPGVALGHRRLNIIDLTEAAAQPMANPDGTVQLVFNGEIDNFADLRAELRSHGHQFRSRSDTEVIVHGYLPWGDGMIDRLHGMFAFGLWDARRRRFLAARDRMEKSRSTSPSSPPRRPAAVRLRLGAEGDGPAARILAGIDPQALARYLAFEYVPPPRTIFAGVRKLDAAEKLVLDLGDDIRGNHGAGAQPLLAVAFPAEHRPVWRPEDAAAELHTLLTRAVERRLVCDVPLGVFLSGGLDSSTVAAFMATIAGADRMKTFSIAFSDPSFDESVHARAVARHLDTDHHEERLDPGSMLASCPRWRLPDEPLADASIVPTYLLSRFTRQHVTVALGGDGGDELFAGYPTFKADLPGRLFFERLPAAARTLVARAAAAILPAGTGYFSLDFKLHQFLRGGTAPGPRRHQRWLSSFLPEELARLLRPAVAVAVGDPLDDVEAWAASSPARDEADPLMDFYARFYLANDVNVKVDWAAGAVGLEVRAPLQDTEVVTFACQLPPSLRLRGLTTKYVLKRAMRGRLPPAIIHRKKQGFAVPVARWMKQDLRSALLDELAPDKLRREGLFDPAAVAS